VHADRDELLRVLVVLLPDPELVGAEEHVRQRVGGALVLEHRVARHVPAVAKEARRFVQRNPAEVTRLLTGNPVRLILVVAPGPLADEVDLRKRRHGRQHE
jgi:hypothetical protein